MSLTVEIKVNGMPIETIYINNTGEIAPGQFTYDYVWHRVDTMDSVAGFVEHTQSDGARKLIQIVLDAIEKKRGDF